MDGTEHDDGGTLLPSLRGAQSAGFRPGRCPDTAPLRRFVSGSSDSGGLAAGLVQRRADVSQGLGDCFAEWTSRTLGAVSDPPCIIGCGARAADYPFGHMTNVTMAGDWELQIHHAERALHVNWRRRDVLL